MKRKIFVAAAMLTFLGLGRAHGMSAGAGAMEWIIEKTQLEVLASNVNQYYTMYQSLLNAYEQLKNIENMAETEADNFKKLDPSHMDYRDWANFVNEQMDNEQRIEARLHGIRVNIGGRNSYSLTDIDDLKKLGADVQTREEWWRTRDEMTNEDRRAVWMTAGMTGSNYAYMKVWEDRDKWAADKIAGLFGGEDGGGALADEQQKSADERKNLEQDAAKAKGANELTGAVIKGQGVTDNILMAIDRMFMTSAAEESAFHNRIMGLDGERARSGGLPKSDDSFFKAAAGGVENPK